MKIKECIVVEGKSDTVAIQRAVKADTIETGGSAINPEVLDKIKLAHKRRGVIIFTDPDYAGERIRKIVQQNVPGCKHAFLPQEEASKKGKFGVEHASPSSIRKALEGIRSEEIMIEENITWKDLIEARLVIGADARQRRMELGKILRIGYANGKQLHKRLNAFLVSEKDFWEAVNQVDRQLEGGVEHA